MGPYPTDNPLDGIGRPVGGETDAGCAWQPIEIDPAVRASPAYKVGYLAAAVTSTLAYLEGELAYYADSRREPPAELLIQIKGLKRAIAVSEGR